jgi:alkaline phosphatase D
VALPASVANGSEIRFRWVDDNADQTSPDQTIGLDDLSITAGGSSGGCNTPAGLTASSITTTGATLGWSSVAGATAYNLQWRLASSSTFNTVSNLGGTSYTLTGLTAATSYVFQVQAVCGTTSSVYSATSSFTTGSTGGGCATPTGLATSSITTTGATLGWSSVAGATAYNLQWRLASSSTFNTVSNLTANSYTLTGLTAATSYVFQVQAVCGTTSSTYSATSTFTTSSSGGGPANEVIYIWSGALQPTTATVVAKMTSASTTCRAVVSTSQTLSNPIYSAFASASSSNNFMAKMNITGLAPGTIYYYGVESNGLVDSSSDDIGRFTTPSAGAFSYTFTVGSCSGTGNHGVYTAMQNKDPLFFMQTGDFHYSDPNSSNINTHRTPYETSILSQTPSRNFLKNTGLAYMWDDHDYCGNNNVGSGLTGTANARQAYQEYIPHYPLVAGSGNVPIYQSFTIGRIHFILADLRSMRTSTSMFGTTQKNWFKQQCLFARDNCLMIAWVSGTSFGGNQSDNWGGFTAERTELGNWFRDNNIQNMFIMSGDAHMLAIDNGNGHDFSTGSNNPNKYPVLQAAALNKSGSNKGGTYSQGAYPNPSSSNGQYATVTVSDNGGASIGISFRGYRTSGNNTTESVVVSYSFERTLCTPAVSCGTPTGLTATGVTGTGATLGWGAVTGATSYDVQWRTSSASTFTTIAGVTSTSTALTGLTAGTGHVFQVRANCAGGSSSYSALGTFTTTATAGPLNETVYMWSGAIQPTSATVVAKMTSTSTSCRAVVSTSPTLSNPVYSSFTTAGTSNNRMAKMNITGLQPNTTYYYAVESNGLVDNSSDDIGRFKTPANGAFSFKFGVASCSNTGNHQVYTAIANKDPLFFLQTGDFHYVNPNSSDINVHRDPYESRILSQSPSATLFRNHALAYTWDDHDYCGNNSSGSGLTGSSNARQAYQEYIPHYPLAAGSGNVPIYQAFTIGRVHIILMDGRSARVPGTSMMGTTQKNWFKQQCLFARDNCLMTVWVTSTMWGGDAGYTDNWGGYLSERTELANWFRDNQIANMLVLSGDAHMLGIDNGTNHDFTTGAANPYPLVVMTAASLNTSGNDAGPNFSQGKFANPSSSNGQYGMVEVTDTGGPSISITLRGYRTGSNSSTDSQLTSYTFNRTICPTAGMTTSSLSVQDAGGTSGIQLAWDVRNVPQGVQLLRSADGTHFESLRSAAEGVESHLDAAPHTGWNHYRLVNGAGEVLQERSLFYKGSGTVRLFPNPAQEMVNVEVVGIDAAMEGRYLVYSERKSVLQGDIRMERGRTGFQIDISELASGTYTVVMQLNGMELAEKIIVAR